MPIIGDELSVFFHAILTGAVVGGVYAFLVLVRKVISHSIVIISIEDIIFWIWAALYIFIRMYNTSYGSVRWYFILGIVVGVLVELFLFRKCKKCLDKWRKKR